MKKYLTIENLFFASLLVSAYMYLKEVPFSVETIFRKGKDKLRIPYYVNNKPYYLETQKQFSSVKIDSRFRVEFNVSTYDNYGQVLQVGYYLFDNEKLIKQGFTDKIIQDYN
ncbi:hypothetical protein [Emticicia sp. W12TSBA100-4]|uniref:hypothetical protein n=1 Tax=Emticicia sp. W12TSBA100-4 TaxID=3160965 RepID=UPI003305A6BE